MRRVAKTQLPFRVGLKGTGSFRPVSPVVYLNLVDGFDECVRLHQKLQLGPLERALPFPYHPHITVAHDISADGMDQAQETLQDFEASFPVSSMGLYEHDSSGVWQLREELGFGGKPETHGSRKRQNLSPPNAPGSGWRSSARGKPWGRPSWPELAAWPGLLAWIQYQLARLNATAPMRAFQQYNLQHGPLMAAGVGFKMFFSITGLLATGFSVAGLFLRQDPALLDAIITSVAKSAPGPAQGATASDGLVDPATAAEPHRTGPHGHHRRRSSP